MTKDDFIKNIVFGYIEKDIQKMISAEEDSDGYGALNFPLAYCVISYMGVFGTFLAGKDSGIKESLGVYINTCLNNYSKELNTFILGEIVRNGLAHDYFSRIYISKNENKKIFYIHTDGNLVLNIKTLAKIFLESLTDFKKNLNDDNFYKRSRQIKDCIDENNKSIQSFTNSLAENSSPDSSKILYSGPSINPLLDKK
jgi:hypothetical protein